MKKIQTLLLRPDFRSNPVKAVIKRLIWRIRWKINKHPWLYNINGKTKIFLTNSGSCALIYYLGSSEPETTLFLMKYLKPGMVFFDIGAHIGEYALIAGEIIGPDGFVHAFEPNPKLYAILVQNSKLNESTNIICNKIAISNTQGRGKFNIEDDASFSSITQEEKESAQTIDVLLQTVDSYSANLEKIDLIKVDVEGAEWLVFNGAKRILQLPPDSAPIWLFEYIPQNYKKFGVDFRELMAFLNGFGYRVFEPVFDHNKISLLEITTFSSKINSGNLVAMKQVDGHNKTVDG